MRFCGKKHTMCNKYATSLERKAENMTIDF